MVLTCNMDRYLLISLVKSENMKITFNDINLYGNFTAFYDNDDNAGVKWRLSFNIHVKALFHR